ncbi:MAG: hypothetical protein AMJ53_15250 [Gammaproteobacteria bacterium SG8_11]|nr:MAG: hypothetical protein AMJ53_15250 [Gammaproteobacteria bacterium SG8_11]
MGERRFAISSLNPVQFETLSLANSTAVGLNSTSRTSGQVLRLSVETQNVRFREDGTDPTLNTGVLLQANTAYEWHGYNGTSALKFQRTTGTATVSVMVYKHDGGEA